MRRNQLQDDMLFLSAKLALSDYTQVVYTVLRTSNKPEKWLEELEDEHDSSRNKTLPVRSEFRDGHSLSSLFQRGSEINS